MKTLLLILTLLYSAVAIAQTGYSVSLEGEQAVHALIENDPYSIETINAYLRLASNYSEAKNYGKAEVIFKDIIKRYPDSSYNSNAHYNLGYIALKKGDTATAIQKLEQLIADSTLDYLGYDTTKKQLYGNPNFMYKHSACDDLIAVFNEKEDYSKMLKYLELKDNKYIVTQMCGVGVGMRIDYEMQLYYTALMGLKDTVAALEKMLSYVQCSPDGKSYEKGAETNELHTVLHLLYTPKQIEDEVKRSAIFLSVGERNDDWLVPCYGTLFGYKVIVSWERQLNRRTRKPRPDYEILGDAYRSYTQSRFFKGIHKRNWERVINKTDDFRKVRRKRDKEREKSYMRFMKL